MRVPEAEATMRLCRNLFGKFVKWQLGNFIFWRVLAIWIHCGAPCARCRIRRPRVEVLWSRVRSSVRPQWCWPQQPQKYFVTQCVICCYAIFLVLLKITPKQDQFNRHIWLYTYLLGLLTYFVLWTHRSFSI